MATVRGKGGTKLVALGFLDGSFNVANQVVKPDSAPVILSDGTVVSADTKGNLIVNGEITPLHDAPSGGVGVTFKDPGGSTMTAVLNADGSYSIGGFTLSPGSGQLTSPSNTTVSVGSGGQIVVNGQKIQPSLIPSGSGSGFGGSSDEDNNPKVSGEDARTKATGPKKNGAFKFRATYFTIYLGWIIFTLI